MIRHLPEGLVPFEECGYDRKPLHPQEGQEIRLGCLCDGAAPVWESADGRSIPDRPGSREEPKAGAQEAAASSLTAAQLNTLKTGSIAIHGRFRRRREPCGIALSAERKAPRGSKRTFFAPFP